MSDMRGCDARKAHMSRYLIHPELKENEEAIAALTTILKFNPNDEAIYQLRSNTYHTSGQYKKAIADYTRLIEIILRSTWGCVRRVGSLQNPGQAGQCRREHQFGRRHH